MKNDLFEFLKHAEIQFMRVLWCDNANVIRSKAIHVRVLADHVEHGVGISAGQMALPVMYDAIVPNSGLGPVGEIRLVPDLTTMTALPYAPGHVRALGDMVVDGKPWAVCPRGFLKRMVAEAQREGLEIKAAFENEFYLLRAEDEQILPADETVFGATLSMDVNTTVMNEIADALMAQDMTVELYHPESGPGQQEMTIQYAGAVSAADRQIAFRETVHAVAMRNGLRASFLPKIFGDKAGSGCHLHVSLWRDGRNVFSGTGTHGMSEEGEAFIAGILAHLPALMAVTTPTCNSYRRLQPHVWSGAFQCWGMDNREAAVRVPSSPGGPPTNFELKTVDASSNPYLALGAAIACGLDGIRRKTKLPASLDVDPGGLSDKDRAARSVQRLPKSLEEALRGLRKDEVIQEAMGAPLAQAFMAVRQAEWDALHGVALEDEVSLLLERY